MESRFIKVSFRCSIKNFVLQIWQSISLTPGKVQRAILLTVVPTRAFPERAILALLLA